MFDKVQGGSISVGAVSLLYETPGHMVISDVMKK